MLCKIYPCSRQFVKTLVGEKNLLERLVTVASVPQFFDGLDVLHLCNGQTESIWGPKETDHCWVMVGSMLSWKGETFSSDTFLLENHLILVKVGQSVFKLNEGSLCDDVILSNITEF